MRYLALFTIIWLTWNSALVAATTSPAEFNIVNYGGIGDGKTMNTAAFAAVIKACADAGGGRVVVPKGIFLTGPVQLMNHVDLHVEDGALVLFSHKFEDFPLAVVNYEGRETVECRSPIWGDHLDHVSITGPGTFDAQGDFWRPLKKSKVSDQYWDDIVKSGGVVSENGSMWYPSQAAREGEASLGKLRVSPHALQIAEYGQYRELLRPALLLLSNCHDVMLDGPTFKNSPNWMLHLLLSDGVTVQNVTVNNPAYAQNGDGIDVDSCRQVTIKDSTFNAGDDGICLKSGRDEEGRRRGRPTENVTITNCTVGHAHGGFVIGSEMSGGVRNITVSHCTFTGTDAGLRFKSNRGRGGTVENIHVNDVTMSGIQGVAILFDMYYMTRGVPTTQAVNDGTPIFRNFDIQNITCKGAKKAILIRGLPEMPIEGIALKDVHISASEGVSLIDARNIRFSNVHVDCESEPSFEKRNLEDFVAEDFSSKVKR